MVIITLNKKFCKSLSLVFYFTKLDKAKVMVYTMFVVGILKARVFHSGRKDFLTYNLVNYT